MTENDGRQRTSNEHPQAGLEAAPVLDNVTDSSRKTVDMEGGKYGLAALNNSGVPECLVVGSFTCISLCIQMHTNTLTHAHISTHLWRSRKFLVGGGCTRSEVGWQSLEKVVNSRDGCRATTRLLSCRNIYHAYITWHLHANAIVCPSFYRPRFPLNARVIADCLSLDVALKLRAIQACLFAFIYSLLSRAQSHHFLFFSSTLIHRLKKKKMVQRVDMRIYY